MKKFCLLVIAFLISCGSLAAFEKDFLAKTGVQGGLVVHLGCGKGHQTADLWTGNQFLVHGLDSDPRTVEKARQFIAEKGLYGKVSVNRLTGKNLPYADNIVNLLVVENDNGISREEMFRVLVPNGILYFKSGDNWKKSVKPWPKQRDEWTHFLHGPDGNPVAKDSLVGPPRYLQWNGSPKFSRGHEQQASFSSCVTSAGRIFYIADEAPAADIRIPSQWKLIARDAFNGIVLWKRDLGKWVSQFRRFRSGPVNLQFRVVAAEDRLFTTLDFQGPVSVLDAASGKTLRVIEGSEYTKQILHSGGNLVLLADEFVGKIDEIDAARRRGEFIQRNCKLLKVNAENGEKVWSLEIKELVFENMALKDGRLFCQTPTRVLCFDANTGKQQWEAKFTAQLKSSSNRIRNGEMQWESPSLLVGDKAVYAADFKVAHAYAVDSGKLLWSTSTSKGYNSPPDMHLVGDSLWIAQKGKRVALDPMSGKVQKQITPHRGYMHARCYRNKATEQFLMLGQMGVQILDFEKGEIWDNDWVRGTCQYGILPANGLLYVPPNSCACNMKSKLIGITALSATRKQPRKSNQEPLLEKGPAFGKIKEEPVGKDDWPTFRATAGRTGALPIAVGIPQGIKWQAIIGGRLSAVVCANQRVYVAAIDRHTLFALDAESGKTLWTFTAGGRIDSPPTIHSGTVFFGSADGWVYAVRAKDGELAWRFQAAPNDRLILNEGQLESAWPVHGSVLVHKGELKIAAGRSSYLDGGIHLYRLKPETGKVISHTVIYSPTPEGKQPSGGGRDVRGALTDILLADGDGIYMRHVKLDFEKGDETGSGVHLFSPLGFLDDFWWHRAYWVFGDHFQSHWSGWWKVGNAVPSGRILSYNTDAIFGFGRDKYNGGNTGQWRGGENYQLFSVDRKTVFQQNKAAGNGKGKKRKGKRVPKAGFKYNWTKQIPLLATGLAVSKKAVFASGPPDLVKIYGRGNQALKLKNPEEVTAAWAGKKGGILYAASVVDGTKLAQYPLPAPTVFDGLAAANGKLYLALKDGSLVCMAGN